MLFDGWDGVVRVALTGAAAYLAIVVLLRVSGKRTLSKMNAFDFIVTIALGSALSATILDENISLAEGVTAFAVLIAAQYLITWLSFRSTGFRDLMKANPRMVYYQGDFLKDAMRRERVTESEVRAAIRAEGGASPGDVAAVVLETDGSFTVVKDLAGRDGRSVLENVEGA
jgi:uncharacterized membrane protein YcaP (DUF421 family)